MYFVRGVCGIGDRSLRIAVGAERDTVERGGTRTWPVVSAGRFLWVDGVGARHGSECRLDLSPTAGRQRRLYLRTSRAGPTFGSARCRLWRRTNLQLIGIHA